MRLIDADTLTDCVHDVMSVFKELNEDDYRHIADKQPTIDAVPVVPCKDCKWSNVYQVDSDFPMERWCDGGFIPKSVQDDDYCSWAERKDDER